MWLGQDRVLASIPKNRVSRNSNGKMTTPQIVNEIVVTEKISFRRARICDVTTVKTSNWNPKRDQKTNDYYRMAMWECLRYTEKYCFFRITVFITKI